MGRKIFSDRGYGQLRLRQIENNSWPLADLKLIHQRPYQNKLPPILLVNAFKNDGPQEELVVCPSTRVT